MDGRACAARHSAGSGQERGAGLRQSLPLLDRVMLVRADALATPVTQFDSDKNAVADAIRRSRPEHVGAESGAGAGIRAASAETAIAEGRRDRVRGRRPDRRSKKPNCAVPPNLRVISIPSNGENVGLRKLSVRRATSATAGADTWEAFVELRNDGSQPARSRCCCNSRGGGGQQDHDAGGGLDNPSDVHVSRQSRPAFWRRGLLLPTAAAMRFRRMTPR